MFIYDHAVRHFLDLSGVGFADDDEVNQSTNLSPDPDRADFEDPELLAIAEKLKELEQSDSDESKHSGDWMHARGSRTMLSL